MSQPRSAPPDLPGFTLVRGIGGGGFADVFLYDQERPFRSVAVKVLRAEHVSEPSLRQFATEADVMARVSAHPNIVTIYTSGVAPDGRPYIVMEHYPNPHFGLRARGGHLALSEVLRVGVQVASAVETAHRAHILHRDIKPANILTSEYGRPGLTDFGISGVRTGAGIRAAAGVTLAYSSPEVLLDEHHGGSEASDVYSLCATIYSLVAGHSPSWAVGGDNSDGAVLQRVTQGIVPPLARPGVPASLNHLLANGLSPDPARRPPSALALVRALQSIEQELSLAPTPLEIRDDLTGQQPALAAAAPGERDEHDAEGTRRAAPRIVDPWSPASPPSATAPAGVGGTSPPAPGPMITPMPETARDGDHQAVADTVLRPGAAIPDRSVSESDTTAVMTRRARLLIATAAVALVVAAAGAIWTRAGQDEPPPAAAPTTVRLPDNPVVPDRVDGPTGVAVDREATGTVVVSFAVLGSPGPPPRVRVLRVGQPWPSGEWYETRTGSPATFTGIPQGETVCVEVVVVAERGRMSEPSPVACTGPRS